MRAIDRAFFCGILTVGMGLAGCAQQGQQSKAPKVEEHAAPASPGQVSSLSAVRSFKLSQREGWRLNLIVTENPDGSIRPGQHEFSKLSCGGTFQFEKRESDGSVVLRQRISYGSCVQNCQLVLSSSYDSYREVCAGRVTGGGKLAKVQVAGHASPENSPQPTDGTSIRGFLGTNPDTRIDKSGSDILAISSNGHLRDGKNSVIWRVCEVGRVFDRSKDTCVGEPLKFTWVDAIAAVNSLNKERFEGFNDWRLPNSNDLKSLLLSSEDIRKEVPKFLSQPSSRGWEALKVCTYSNNLIGKLFSKYGQQSGFYSSQHWLSDNAGTSWQEPVSFNFEGSFGMNYHGYCNLVNIAFKENKPHEMRAHAEIPIVVVRGRDDGQWKSIQIALSKRSAILAESENAGNRSLKFYDNMIGGVVKWVRKNASSGSSETSNTSDSPRYEIYKDKGTAPVWTWFAREVVVKCLQGREKGNYPSVYLERSGGWSTTYKPGKFPTMIDVANAACE